MDKLNLMERLDPKLENDLPVIDYEDVEKRISVMRNESLDWLTKALGVD